MTIEELHHISEKKGLEYYGGDGDKKLFTDPVKALEFCASLECTYALWHGCELVIAFTKE